MQEMFTTTREAAL